MVMPRQPAIGGWYPGRIQLSPFIRDFLSDGQESWGWEIWQAYKQAVQSQPLRRGKGRRQVISYENFRHYLWMLRRLGLIVYLYREGKIDTEDAVDTSGLPAPHLAPKHYIQADMSRINDPAWQNPKRTLYG